MKKKKLKTFDQHLDERYGKTGSVQRVEFEIKSKAFAVGELIKEKRLTNQIREETNLKNQNKKYYK